MSSKRKHYVVTGGAGYIGSVLSKALMESGNEVTIVDVKTPPSSLHTCSHIEESFEKAKLNWNEVDGVFHLAALTEVEESTREPELYFENNVTRLETFLKALPRDIPLVFSSTSSVYKAPDKGFYDFKESDELAAANPYGSTKIKGEEAIKRLHPNAVICRFANVAGAAYGLGEEREKESHLIPTVIEGVLSGQPVYVFGADYKTHDGTAVRDYVHALDVITAMMAAMRDLHVEELSAPFVVNISTGKGYSVLEVIREIKKALPEFGCELSDDRIHTCPRRAGDEEYLVLDNSRLERTKWIKKFRTLKEMVHDTLEFKVGRQQAAASLPLHGCEGSAEPGSEPKEGKGFWDVLPRAEAIVSLLAVLGSGAIVSSLAETGVVWPTIVFMGFALLVIASLSARK